MVQLYSFQRPWECGRSNKKHGDGVLASTACSRRVPDEEFGFSREQSLQITGLVLLKATTQMHSTNLRIGTHRHLQTTELIFRVCLIAQVNISFGI